MKNPYKMLTQSKFVAECVIHWCHTTFVNCAGEQDESAFDISQLQKPISSPRARFAASAVEKVMPPPIRSADRPKKWGKCIIALLYFICLL